MSPPESGNRWQALPRSLSYRRLTAVGSVGVLGIAPLVTNPLQLAQLVPVLYLMMFAMSWDLVSGYTGQISFGHTLFFGLAAYTTTVLNLQHGISPILSIPIGVGMAMLGGLAIGIPALRVRGPYLSLITLVAPLIVAQGTILFANRLPFLAPAGLGGVTGFASQNDPIVGRPTPTTDPLLTVGSYRWEVIGEYYVGVVALLVILGISLVVTRSATGTVFTAIREDEDVVAAAGLSPSKFKIFAFVLSAGLAGLASGLFVHSNAGGNPLHPSQVLGLQRAVEVVIMAVLGGMGTIVGAIVGAIFFVVLTVSVRAIDVTLPLVGYSVTDLSPIPVYLLAIVVLILEPRGLLGWVRGRRGTSGDGQHPPPLTGTFRRYLEEFERFR